MPLLHGQLIKKGRFLPIQVSFRFILPASRFLMNISQNSPSCQSHSEMTAGYGCPKKKEIKDIPIKFRRMKGIITSKDVIPHSVTWCQEMWLPELPKKDAMPAMELGIP